MKDSIEIKDVTPAQMENIGRFLMGSDVTGFSGNAGSVKGHCLAADYKYDPGTGVLIVRASELPEAFRKAPAAAVVPAFEGLIRSIARRTLADLPSKYGVYDYVLPTVNNQSGGTITYSNSNPSNGTISITNNKIDTGSSLQAFEADSSKLSGTGVGGTCEYTLADGQTVLTITYFLNTIYTHTFTAGLSGFNAPRFSTSLANTDPSLDDYTYLIPTITLSKA